MSHFENSLSHWPDHADGIVGLSNLLMDIYEEKLPAEEPEESLLSYLASSTTMASGSTLDMVVPPAPRVAIPTQSSSPSNPADSSTPYPSSSSSSTHPTPPQLNRLACRDRASMLLTALTKLGTGAQSPEAWLALARSHELSGQTGRAKKALWWVVRLEEARGVRDWGCVVGR